MKKAFITGITGQDGSYLAELLLNKGYEVHGMKRRASSFNTSRIDHIFENQPEDEPRFFMHYGDLSDSTALIGLIQKIQPDEIYNLAAQSHVKVSFENPEYTADIDALGTLRLLEAMRILGLQDKTRFYQASTSELFGKVREIPQKETTPFYPRSPYACAKLYAYWICVNYRESYNMYACNGILFNHESPRRGETFVTRKITRGLARTTLGLSHGLKLGNLDALRDWGHARDYVYMQWLMLQQKNPQDFVIATGQQTSVRDFVRMAADMIGISLEFTGSGLEEKGIVSSIDREILTDKFQIPAKNLKISEGDEIVSVNPAYFRPAEVETLLGDSRLAHDTLGWKPRTTLNEMTLEMISADMEHAKKEALLKSAGYRQHEARE